MTAAVDYIGTPNGMYRPIGEIVYHINLLRARAIDLGPGVGRATDNICNILEAATGQDNRRVCSQMTTAQLNAMRQACTKDIEALGRIIETRILDRATVLTPLNLEGANIDRTLEEIINDMYGNDSVKANVLSIGSVTANASNIGNGSVAADLTLDAVSRPCQRYRSHRKYNGLASQLAIPETITVMCIADGNGQVHPSFAGNYGGVLVEPNFVVGNERYYVWGKIPPATLVSSTAQYGSGYGIDDVEGSGSGPIFYGVNTNLGTPETTFISNPQFESGAANEPDDWGDDSAGTAGACVFLDTGTKFIGTQSLKFTEDGTATIRRAQFIDPQYLIGGKKYYLSLWLKCESGLTGTLTVCFAGTSYTAAAGEKITVTLSGGSTSWTHYGLYLIMPPCVSNPSLAIPSDWKLKIEVTSATNTGKSLWLDDVNLKEAVWHGGFSLQAYNGDIAPHVGDRWTFPITRSVEGVCQTFARRWWGIQLPSKDDASETVNDAWFTGALGT